MNMKSNKFLIIAAAFILMAFITGYIYHRGKHRHPFRYELDLVSLNDWYEGLVRKDGGGHFVINFDDSGPFDFSNDKDTGSDSLRWSSKEDDYFIVYYPKDMDPRTGSYRASNCLEVAHRAIPDLESSMGRYYYPQDVMDNRKLSIYLPGNDAAYTRIINELAGTTVNSENSIGMTISTVTQCGPVVDGIVINPYCFEPGVSELDGYRATLRHEMSHYVYFMALDYGSNVSHPLWVAEGIAEFIGRQQPQISGADSIKFIATQCNLDEEFPSDGRLQLASYWAGESFFKFVSDSCGVKAPAELMSSLYDYSVPVALSSIFKDSDPKDRWLESLRQSDTLRHPEYLDPKANHVKN